MMSLRRGIVTSLERKFKGRTDIMVKINENEERAINYNNLTGEVEFNDEVILNTTAVDLKLGTGGYHYVVANLRYSEIPLHGQGHIMKLRYTPYQLKVLAAEEQTSPHHDVFKNFKSLEGLPVIVATLHSMLIPIACTLKQLNHRIRIAYIMTDGAALPIDFSNTVYELRSKKIIDHTITIGHAFGGELECVNIYNGLIAAKELTQCDVIIVSMGPGIVGTGTTYGFSGIEQGSILDAVDLLKGTAIAVPRISFADPRIRHKGMSHHSLTVLDKITRSKSKVVLPHLNKEQKGWISHQIQTLGLDSKHEFIVEDGSILEDALQNFNLSVNSMGRSFSDDPAFFLTCSAAATYVHKMRYGFEENLQV